MTNGVFSSANVCMWSAVRVRWLLPFVISPPRHWRDEEKSSPQLMGYMVLVDYCPREPCSIVTSEMILRCLDT